MVANLAIYTVVHQPRRLKLPAQPIPRGATIEDIARCVFDEPVNERYFSQVAASCYYPATRMFLRLVREQGLRLSIGISLSFVQQAERWEPALLDLLRELIGEENVELIGVDPYHSFLFLLDLPAFVLRMQWMGDEMARIFGKRPAVTDTTEMSMSAAIYNALDTAGFRGALLDGRQWVLEWREPTHLYRYSDEDSLSLPLSVKRSQYTPRSKRSPQKLLIDNNRESGPYLLARHTQLSDDVGFRFSDTSWSQYPLYADTYARWIAGTPGDVALLGWDYETFGEHHHANSGIFDFLNALPSALAQQGVETSTASDVIDRFAIPGSVHHLPLPIFPTTWAGSGGLDFFTGNAAQQTILQLMGYVYGQARLTENPDLVDLALWLAQSDNLHLIQWFGRSGPEAAVSAHFTPREWLALGPERIIHEQQQVYVNVLHAMEPYLPARLIRRARSSSGKPARRYQRDTDSEPGLSVVARRA